MLGTAGLLVTRHLASSAPPLLSAAGCACPSLLRLVLVAAAQLGASPDLFPACRQLSTSAATNTSSSSRSSDSGAGPPREKLRAVPFSVTPETAVAAFKAYHSSNIFLSAQSAAIHKLKEAFLPFWMVSGEAQVHVSSADVGHDYLTSVYDPVTKRYQPRTETRWTRVFLDLRWERPYGADNPDMQIYAASKYPRPDIRKVAPGPHAVRATAITPDMMTATDGASTRRTGPYTVLPASAAEQATKVVESAERAVAEDLVKRQFSADRIRFLSMTVHLSSRLVSPVLVPVYIFSNKHADVKIRSFVSGVDASKISGTRVYDEMRVATVTGVTAVLINLLAGTIRLASFSAALYLGVLLPMAAAWAFARYYPVLRAWMHTPRASSQQDEEWDAEWVRAWEEAQSQRRQRFEGSDYDWSGSGTGTGSTGAAPGSRSDPLNYYKTLGVDPGCSNDELQAAFRGLALKHHPDRVTDPRQKQLATEQFQRISQAYQVLRSPQRRRAYDSGQYRG